MYSYAGQHEDELAFNVGDIITLISKEEEAWWKGELDGNQGVFPSNYVEEINCKYIFSSWKLGFLLLYFAHGTAATNSRTKGQEISDRKYEVIVLPQIREQMSGPEIS